MTNPLTLFRDWRASRALAKARANAPRSIDEAVDRMLAEAPPDLLARFKAEYKESCIIGFGWGGMSMRNSWDLWRTENDLTRELAAAGVLHGDDRSALIYTALWCRLNRVPFVLKDEVRRYERHWANAGCAMDGSPLPSRQEPRGMMLRKDPATGRWLPQSLD